MSELDGFHSPPGSSTGVVTEEQTINAWHSLNDAIVRYVCATDSLRYLLLLQVNEVFRRACEDGMASALAIPSHGRHSWWIICGNSRPKKLNDWTVEGGGAKASKDGLVKGSAKATWSFCRPDGQMDTRVYQLARLVVTVGSAKFNLYIVNEPGDIQPPPRPEGAGQSPHLVDQTSAASVDYSSSNWSSPSDDPEEDLSNFTNLRDVTLPLEEWLQADDLSSVLTFPNSDTDTVSLSSSNKSLKRGADSGPYDRIDDRCEELTQQMSHLSVRLDQISSRVEHHGEILHSNTEDVTLRAAILDLLSRQTHPMMAKDMVRTFNQNGGTITKPPINSILYKMKIEKPPKVAVNSTYAWTLVRG
ncbi:hypothetical protein PROFUN_02901 [Planoprotostelium fungivorum]|uniref:Uncharacterized protein n=1 Tax=Planoprotostelium fungivorum TaxID=1890364 RepID=A0A2P6NS00_9EUKA|nr:hypothetical protein PROFUN_02901 [Planoprotostelium fungivorum]